MLVRNLKTYVADASDDREIGVVVISTESGFEIATTYAVEANVNAYGELMIIIAVETNDNLDRLDEMPVDVLKKPQNGYPPGRKTFTELDGDMLLDCIRLFDYSCCLGFLSSFSHASGIAIDLGINDKNQDISKLASVFSINTQANRRETVKALKICLSAIRDNEMLSLETIPEFMRCSERFALGFNAIKVIGEVIDMLASIY